MTQKWRKITWLTQ